MDDLLVATFEAHNPERNHHRWYRVRVGKDLFGDWTVCFGYGRVGQAGQTRRYASNNPDDLLAVIRACIVRRRSAPTRLGCGYRLVHCEAVVGIDPRDWLPAYLMAVF